MVIGIDEVGRGSLAGPLVIGAVALGKPIKGLKDSKDLSKLQRQKLTTRIYETARYAKLGWVWPHEIDDLGLTAATSLAIERALEPLQGQSVSVIIDGNYNYLKNWPNVSTMIKADSLIPSVSAASIIAKVARDRYMLEMNQYLSNYNFASHVGYGTKLHLETLRLFGPCVLHRKSFKPVSLV